MSSVVTEAFRPAVDFGDVLDHGAHNHRLALRLGIGGPQDRGPGTGVGATDGVGKAGKIVATTEVVAPMAGEEDFSSVHFICP
jgi:hypothetical protein